MSFPSGFSKLHLRIDASKVAGSLNLADFPVLVTEQNVPSSLFASIQGQEIYENFLLNDSALQGYWRMESNWNDSSPNAYHLTPQNSPTNNTSGKFGNGGDFEYSSSQYATIVNASCPNLEPSGSFVFGCWVKFEDISIANAQILMGKKNDPSVTGDIELYKSTGSSGTLRFYVAGLTTNTEVDSGIIPQVGIWYHVVGIYDKDRKKLKIFVNGRKKEVTASGTPTSTSGDFSIARNGKQASGYIDGMVDDAFMLSRALSDVEALALYTGGADIRFTTDASGLNQIPHEVVLADIVSSKLQINVKIPTLDYDDNTDFYLWYGGTDSPFGRELDKLYALKSDANLQGYWKLESDFTDSSANSYNLTANNTPVFVAGKFNNGVDLEAGSSQSGTIADASCPNLEISTSQTWAGWIKAESLHIGRIMTKQNTYTKALYTSNDGTVIFYIDGLSNFIASDALYTVGQWVFVCGVWDSGAGKLKLWINGVKKETSSITGTPLDTNGNFAIGQNGSTANTFFDGVLDDLMIFNRALTDAEVLTLLGSHRPTYANTYQLVSHDGGFRDSSLNEYDLTQTNLPVMGVGKVGESLDYELSSSQNSNISNANSPNLAVTGSRSLIAFIKPESLAGGNMGVLTKRGEDNSYRGYDLHITSAGKVEFEITGLTTNTNVLHTTVLSTGVWAFIAGVYDNSGNKLKAFTNTTKVEVTASGTSTDSGKQFAIASTYAGASNVADNFFDGLVDEVMVLNVAVSDDFLATLYNNLNDPATFMSYVDESIGGASFLFNLIK